jgi:hypothetical protein
MNFSNFSININTLTAMQLEIQFMCYGRSLLPHSGTSSSKFCSSKQLDIKKIDFFFSS